MGKKNISRVVAILCLCMLLGSFGTALAAPVEKELPTLPSIVVVERVDVPLCAALGDSSYDLRSSAQAKFVAEKALTRAISWKVWGERSLTPSTHLYKPVGYSEHRDGDTILPTYHYTRTFLGSSSDPRGDSGRVWGSYTVKATGTDCDPDVWTVYIHRVYYGTSE